MKISELFYSIQGEGTLIGVPSFFIRTSGCNLRCTWCDTPYTSWQPEGQERSIDEIISEVAHSPARHVVITGGEPMIAPQIVELTERLKAPVKGIDLHITIETAGTVYAPVVCDLMSISPKLSNSTPLAREGGRWAPQHERLRYAPEVLARLLRDYDYQLKFVITRPEDLAEIEHIRSELQVPPQQILLMPEGTSPDVIRERSLWLVEICKATGYRFSPRLHIAVWGNRRGV